MNNTYYDNFTTISNINTDVFKYYSIDHKINDNEISSKIMENNVILSNDYENDNIFYDEIIKSIISKSEDTDINIIDDYDKNIQEWSSDTINKIFYHQQKIYHINKISNNGFIIIHPIMNHYLNCIFKNSINIDNIILYDKIQISDIYVFGISYSNSIKPLLLVYNKNIKKYNISNSNCITSKIVVKSRKDVRLKKLNRILK